MESGAFRFVEKHPEPLPLPPLQDEPLGEGVLESYRFADLIESRVACAVASIFSAAAFARRPASVVP
jgi:hypothetical protein